MKFIKNAVYSEKYTNKDGEEKTKYTNVGALFQRDDGSMCAKIMGSWINFYDPKPIEPTQHDTDKQNGYMPDDDDQTIPF